MTEGMCYHPIYGHLSPQTNTGYHITHLTDNVICQKPAGVILQYCVDHAVNRHNNTQNNQNL